MFFAQMETILFAGSRNGKRPAKFYRASGKLRRQGQIANTGQYFGRKTFISRREPNLYPIVCKACAICDRLSACFGP
ncbi:hypothetical protein B4100_2121 [Heyndrickxia coagulans]|nr:hypothetical protein B4100_2121 [Heyndrickxia coagulans]